MSANRDKREMDRRNLEFADAVKLAFCFMAEKFDFEVTKEDSTFVRYESDRMFLNIYHGRLSYEIGVEVGLLCDADGYHYKLPEVLGALVGEPKEQNAYYLQASSREGVRRCVEVAADLVRKHYRSVLDGDRFTLARIATFAARRNEQYTLEVVQQPIRDAALRAWQERDFETVVRSYGSIRDDLTLLERRRLNYAQEQLSQP